MKYTSFIAAAVLASKVSARAMIGTNIGGWMVLEPWITPSLFYRFLNKTKDHVGLDSYTFCEALGQQEGNAVMRAHWDAWLTEEHIAKLAKYEVEIVRLPIGDWTLKPYGPYVGCMDGAAEKITWALDTFAKYNIKVLLDVHSLKDSQNGFDNSGKASDVEWTDETHFKHWSIQNASWMGHWNGKVYDVINAENIEWGIDNVTKLMNMWGNHPAVYALEPVNEPWWNSDIPTLKDFYRAVRKEIQKVNPNVKFVFHDSFLPYANIWNDLFADDDIENVVLDTHTYMAWDPTRYEIGQYCDNYGKRLYSPDIQDIKYDVWVGEWSLATDVCAMWLGGFNDSNTEYQFQCEWVDCPYSYLPAPYNVDFDRTAATLGPYGESDRATIHYGQCATDSAFFSDEDVQTLGNCTRDIFDHTVEGQFLWTFRNELEPKWDYIKAYEKGWLKHPKTSSGFSFLQ